MRRDQARTLIDDLFSAQRTDDRFLLAADEEQSVAGLAVAPGPTPGSHQVLVLVEEFTALAREVFNDIYDRANGQARITVTGPMSLDATTLTGSPSHLPARSGSSIGPSNVLCTGTLGGFVTDRNGLPALVSSAHVLTPALDGRTGGRVTHPGLDDGPRTDIATVVAANEVNRRVPHPIDAAAATLDDGVEFSTRLPDGAEVDPEPLDLDGEEPLGGEPDLAVFKVGRTSALTKGRVAGVDGRLRVPYHGTKIQLRDLVLIEGIDGYFTRPGDSGAVVYSARSHRPVSLHVGSSTMTGLSFGHPYRSVLETLDVTPWITK